MPIDINEVVTYGVGKGTLSSDRLADQAPKAFEEMLTAYQAQVAPQLKAADDAAAKLKVEAKALKAEAKTLTGPARDEKLELAKSKLEQAQKVVDDAYGLAGSDVSRISGRDGRDLLLKAEGVGFDEADAGHAMAAVANATLWRAGFGYGTHKPMEAFLADVPADGKLTLNVVCTPSAHVGSDATAQEKMFEQYARTNSYKAEVWFQPAGSSYPTQRLASATFKVQNPPEYATLSPDLVVDIAGLKGNLVVKGSPDDPRSGPEGYTEARVTIIHLA